MCRRRALLTCREAAIETVACIVSGLYGITRITLPIFGRTTALIAVMAENLRRMTASKCAGLRSFTYDATIDILGENSEQAILITKYCSLGYSSIVHRHPVAVVRRSSKY